MARVRFIASVLLLLASYNLAWADAAYKPVGTPEEAKVYLFGIHPQLNPEELYAAYNPIMRYLESKIPGVRFKMEASKDYPSYEAKLAAGQFDFSLPNPYQTLLSLKHGYHVIAKNTPDSDFRGVLVARLDKKELSLAGLKGKTLCFPSATAVAATMLPLMYLYDHGIKAGKDVQIEYVGSQYSSILNAYTGDDDACGTSTRFWRIWSRDNPDKAKQMKVIFTTQSLPHNGIVARNDVPPKLAGQVAHVLAGMDKDPTVDQRQFKIDQAHFELANDATYQPMEEFLKRYDQTIGLPSSMKQN
ncbi:MAG: phosphate/phosphite/phosphonate ABC transporter substrate-binding protein [Burkholderiales bacterium]